MTLPPAKAMDFRSALNCTRFKCTICNDYDLCSNCYNKNKVFKHRYEYDFKNKYWVKSNNACHLVLHEMTPIHLDKIFLISYDFKNFTYCFYPSFSKNKLKIWFYKLGSD